MDMKQGRPNLEEFSATLLALAREDPHLIVVTSDSRGSGKLVPFAEARPQQVVEVGVAEQNLVGIAAGLAAAGKTVYAVSPACFLATRALEQIKNDVAYSDRPVKLIGISAGVSYGALGSTHHSLHDIAALRAIHNMAILAPADNFETREAIRAVWKLPRPCYVRFGKRAIEHVHGPGARFEIGKAITVRQGTDVALIATGETVVQAVLAAARLEAEGVAARVISMHTVKPLDTEALLQAAEACGAVVTVEEHSVAGGLGEACAAALLERGTHPRFAMIGFPDAATVSGSQPEIFAHYGISADGIARRVRQLLGKEGGRT
jgi:transketolase